MQRRLTVLWGYLVEPILAILILILFQISIGRDILIKLTTQLAVDFATLYCAVFFAAALGFLWTLYSKVDTKFYVWLDEIGALKTYINATVYAVSVEGGAIFLLLGTKLYTSPTFIIISAFGFLMALINSVTMITNVIGLIKLQTLFSRHHP